MYAGHRPFLRSPLSDPAPQLTPPPPPRFDDRHPPPDLSAAAAAAAEDEDEDAMVDAMASTLATLRAPAIRTLVRVLTAGGAAPKNRPIRVVRCPGRAAPAASSTSFVPAARGPGWRGRRSSERPSSPCHPPIPPSLGGSSTTAAAAGPQTPPPPHRPGGGRPASSTTTPPDTGRPWPFRRREGPWTTKRAVVHALWCKNFFHRLRCSMMSTAPSWCSGPKQLNTPR